MSVSHGLCAAVSQSAGHCRLFGFSPSIKILCITGELTSCLHMVRIDQLPRR